MHEVAKSSKKIWSLIKWDKERSTLSRQLSKFLTLKKRTQKEMTKIFEEKVIVLRKTFFLSFSETDLKDIKTTEYFILVSMSNFIFEKEMIRAVMRLKFNKTSEINDLLNRFLKMILKRLKTSLTHVFRACLKLEYHLKEFKKVNIIILRKSKKKNYIESKSYRRIVLLNILSKTLKIIIARRLSNYVEDNNMLLNEQMKVRRDRFSETTLKIIMKVIHTV